MIADNHKYIFKLKWKSCKLIGRGGGWALFCYLNILLMLHLKLEPDADQDGCRNRCLFRTESKARMSEIRSTDKKAKE